MEYFFVRILRPVLDVFFIALLIYFGYRILARTRAVQLLKGTVAIILLYGIAFFLKLETLLWIMNFLAPSIVVSLAIVFQPELRHMFTRLGQQRLFNLSNRTTDTDIQQIVDTAHQLTQKQRGALLVITQSVGLSNIIATGIVLEATLSRELLLTIFETDTPLHDGAVIISENKVVAAGCILPLSSQQRGISGYGTRHKAALSLAEESDSVIVIVSEEKRRISLAHNSTMYEDLSTVELRHHLQRHLSLRPARRRSKRARIYATD